MASPPSPTAKSPAAWSRLSLPMCCPTPAAPWPPAPWTPPCLARRCRWVRAGDGPAMAGRRHRCAPRVPAPASKPSACPPASHEPPHQPALLPQVSEGADGTVTIADGSGASARVVGGPLEACGATYYLVDKVRARRAGVHGACMPAGASSARAHSRNKQCVAGCSCCLSPISGCVLPAGHAAGRCIEHPGHPCQGRVRAVESARGRACARVRPDGRVRRGDQQGGWPTAPASPWEHRLTDDPVTPSSASSAGSTGPGPHGPVIPLVFPAASTTASACFSRFPLASVPIGLHLRCQSRRDVPLVPWALTAWAASINGGGTHPV